MSHQLALRVAQAMEIQVPQIALTAGADQKDLQTNTKTASQYLGKEKSITLTD